MAKYRVVHMLVPAVWDDPHYLTHPDWIASSQDPKNFIMMDYVEDEYEIFIVNESGTNFWKADEFFQMIGVSAFETQE